MKIKKFNLQKANYVLAGMILDPTVCARISSKWKIEGLFGGRWQNIVAGWAVKHFKEYGEVLGQESVEVRFSEWAAKSKSEAAINSMEEFFYQFDQNYVEKVQGMSSEYLLDLAGQIFERVRIRNTIEQTQFDLDEDNVEKASRRLAESLKVELGAGSLFKPASDYERWQAAFDADQSEPLITYPGAIGKHFGSDFSRDSFVSFIGITGIGKSFFLLDAAYRAVRQLRRVAFFECGDMSESQLTRRMGQRALRRPKKSCEVKRPLGWDGDGILETEEMRLEGISPQESYREWRKISRKRDLLRVSCHSNISINAEGISSIVEDWAREGWLPDCVICDYADILAPPPGIREYRDQINATWQRLRRLSQDFHCLVLTATQADAESYEKGLLTLRSFTNDRRKNDHVTAMIGLNSNVEEKEEGTYRINFIKRREDEFSVKRVCKVAGSLAMGCPILVSSF